MIYDLFRLSFLLYHMSVQYDNHPPVVSCRLCVVTLYTVQYRTPFDMYIRTVAP